MDTLKHKQNPADPRLCGTSPVRIGRLSMCMFILFCSCDQPWLHVPHMYSHEETLPRTGVDVGVSAGGWIADFKDCSVFTSGK